MPGTFIALLELWQVKQSLWRMNCGFSTGVIFYVLDQTPVEKPQFMRHNDCLTCHNSSNAMNVPGMLVRSQFTAPNGTTMPWLGNYVSDHRSPLSERWGGWYVTGKTGAIRHMGNAVVTNGSNPESPEIGRAHV